MQMGVKFAVHRVDRAGQRDDFKAALERIGVILLLVDLVHADGKAAERTKRLHARKLNVFLERDRLDLLEDFLAAIDADEQRVAKSSVIHRFSSSFGFVFRLNRTTDAAICQERITLLCRYDREVHRFLYRKP